MQDVKLMNKFNHGRRIHLFRRDQNASLLFLSLARHQSSQKLPIMIKGKSNPIDLLQTHPLNCRVSG